MKLATLAAIVLAGSACMTGGAAYATPLSPGQALQRSNASAFETVQYRRWRGHHRGAWWRHTPQYGSCTGDRYNDSAFPSSRCRRF